MVKIEDKCIECGEPAKDEMDWLTLTYYDEDGEKRTEKFCKFACLRKTISRE